MKIFRNNPMAERNPIRPMASRNRDPVTGAMITLVAIAVSVFLVVVVLSYIERGSFL